VILEEQFECGSAYLSESEDKFWEQMKKWEQKEMWNYVIIQVLT